MSPCVSQCSPPLTLFPVQPPTLWGGPAVLPWVWVSEVGLPSLLLPVWAMDPGTPGHSRHLPGPLPGEHLGVVAVVVSRSCDQTWKRGSPEGVRPPAGRLLVAVSQGHLSQPVEVGAGIAIGASTGLWASFRLSSSSSQTGRGAPLGGGACTPTRTTPRGPAAPVWRTGEPSPQALGSSEASPRSCDPADPEEARARITAAASPQSPSRPACALHIHAPRGSRWLPPALAHGTRVAVLPVPHCTARLDRVLPPGAPWLWELTHIVAWIWSFHLGLTVSLVWVWHRFQGTWLWRGRHWRKGAWPRASLGWGGGWGGAGLQAAHKLGYRGGDRLGSCPGHREQLGLGSPGLDLSQRTHWIDRLSWTSLTFLPILPFAMVTAISAALLINGQGTGVGLRQPYCQAPRAPLSDLCSASGRLCAVRLPPGLSSKDRVSGIT